MRRYIFSLVAACACALLLILSFETQAQTYAPWRETDRLPNGQPAPLDFMRLDYQNCTYIRCRYGNGPRNWTQNNGITGTGLGASHYLYTLTNGGLQDDPCRCLNTTPSGGLPTYSHEKFLPPSWDGDANHPLDKAIRIGCYQTSGQCLNSQEIEYWFVPPKDSSALLVYFTFAQENVDNSLHTTDWNPKFSIEVLDGTNSTTEQLVPGGYYNNFSRNNATGECNIGGQNTSWPYNRFLASPSGCQANQDFSCGPDEYGEYKYYWVNTTSTKSTPTTFPYRECPINQTSGYARFPVTWFEYKPLAFNLSDYANQEKAVRLRIRAAGCEGHAHWAYGIFTAKLVPARIVVDACGDDAITLSVPRGFLENTYTWQFGMGENDLRGYIEPGVDPGITGTKFNLIINPAQGARVWPYYVCEMKSYTGVPFTYTADFKKYQIESAFTYEQIVDTNYKCSHIIQLRDTGKVCELTPNESGGYDMAYQTPLKHIEWYYKNSAGVYREIPGSRDSVTCRFNITNTADINLTNFNYGQGGDSIMIKLIMQDSLQKCSDTIEMNIGLDSTFVQPGIKDTTVRICSNQLPYFYQPEKYGQTYRWDYAGTKECHVGSDFEDWSWNYCDSIVKVTLEVMTPRVEIKDLGDYCDSFRTTLTVIPAPNQSFQQSDIQVLNWNGEEYSTGITYQVDHAGVYTVDVSIGAGCVTSASYKVAACMPFMNLPGSITPSNHDGINDCFEIPQKDLVQSLEFTVYNRNGTVVFHTKDVNFKWRGARFSEDYPEKELVNQTYVYTLKMVDYNGKPYPVMKGVILVL